MNEARETPWGRFTALEARTMDALVRLGNLQAIAMEFRVSEKAVQATVHRVRMRMRVDNRVRAALLWSQWAHAAEVALRTDPCLHCAGRGYYPKARP